MVIYDGDRLTDVFVKLWEERGENRAYSLQAILKNISEWSKCPVKESLTALMILKRKGESEIRYKG